MKYRLFLAAFFLWSIPMFSQDRAEAIKVLKKVEKQTSKILELQTHNNLVSTYALLDNIAVYTLSEERSLSSDNCSDYRRLFLQGVRFAMQDEKAGLPDKLLNKTYYKNLKTRLRFIGNMYIDGMPPSCSSLKADIEADLKAFSEKTDALQLDYENHVARDTIFTSYRNQLRQLIELDEKLNVLSGSIGFTYVSNVVNRSDFEIGPNNSYVVGIAAEVNKDIHPGELNFNTSFNVNIDGEQFREQVSNIFMSYDYNISKKADKIGREVFGFLSRYSNTYLNVNQRYETGIGYVHDFVNGGLSKKGRLNKNKIKALKKYLKVDEKKQLQVCSERACQVYPQFAKLTKADIDTVEHFRKHVTAVNKKKHQRHRFGFLVGAFVEFEQISAADSIKIMDPDTTVANPISFSPTQILRFEARLHYTGYFADNVSLSIKPYLIVPFLPFEEDEIKVESVRGGAVREFADIRTVIEAALKVEFGKASFKLMGKYNYDWSPRSAFYDLNGEERLYSVPREHLMTNISFNYKF